MKSSLVSISKAIGYSSSNLSHTFLSNDIIPNELLPYDSYAYERIFKTKFSLKYTDYSRTHGDKEMDSDSFRPSAKIRVKIVATLDHPTNPKKIYFQITDTHQELRGDQTTFTATKVVQRPFPLANNEFFREFLKNSSYSHKTRLAGAHSWVNLKRKGIVTSISVRYDGSTSNDSKRQGLKVSIAIPYIVVVHEPKNFHKKKS